jgi:GntR family transcriptional regulator, transcriptional repressor for pyruvate dehydrogenase complex
MGIKPIRQKSVSSEVLEQMKQQIINGDWPTGSRIPGELQLAKMFGVSRVSVREAIHRLAGIGVLRIKRGDGTYVNEILTQDYFHTLLPILMINKASLKHMLEIRAMIESGSAGLAALRAKKEDIVRLRAALSNMKQFKGDWKKFSAEDLNFHTAIAIATHNSAVVKVNAVIHDMLMKAMKEIVRITGYDDGLYYHAKILEAIEKKDQFSAVTIMKEHIDVTIEKVGKIKDKIKL